MGLGSSCLFCNRQFSPQYNESQIIYSLDVLRHYFLNINTEDNEYIISVKDYFSYLNLKKDNLVDELYEFNKLMKNINKISIEDKGFFRLNPTGDIILNTEAFKSNEDSLAVLELGILMACVTTIQNSI